MRPLLVVNDEPALGQRADLPKHPSYTPVNIGPDRGQITPLGVTPPAPRGIGLHNGGEFRRSMQHEPRMEVSWCEDVARV